MITEIFVEGKKLDISADIASLLTFAIDDISDFSSRQTTFSKTVVLPGTANNNAIFGNIFDTGISNDYDPTKSNIGSNFNASVSAQCIIFQDAFQTFKGTLRIIEIDITKHGIEYQAALNGDLTTLNVALTSGFLSDLDFSAYNRLWNVDNISGSWDNTPGSGVYFPMADLGTYSTDKHNWQFGTFRPALYAKEYIDKMFAAANFRYDCPLFNTERFKRLVIPHNQKQLTKLTTGVLEGSSATEQDMFVFPFDSSFAQIIFGTLTGGLFTTTDNKNFTYTGTDPLTATMTVHIDGTNDLSAVPTRDEPDPPIPFVQIMVDVNATPWFADLIVLDDTTTGDYTRDYSFSITLNQNDVLSIDMELFQFDFISRDSFVTVTDATFSLVAGSAVTSPLSYNEMIDFKFAIPQNILQIDFLMAIVHLFNLYVYEDQFDDRLIHIRPFVQFFDQGTGSVIDWTYKLNRDEVIKIQPMSELTSKLYNFNYASDSDYYNKLYQTRYNQVYGSFIFDSQFEFATETNTLTLIFAPTPLVGYEGEEKVYPTIFSKSGTTEDTTDSVIRILQTLKVTGVASWNILNTATVLGSFTSYGYAGHFDDPDNPGNDLNFGGLSELFFQLAAGELDMTQFNVYWSTYMEEITDKDSKLLTANFYLTTADIFNLTFARFIVVDGVLFRLNKITDYNVTSPAECAVELLKVINIVFSYPPGSTADNDYALLWDDGDPMLFEDPVMIGEDVEMLYK